MDGNTLREGHLNASECANGVSLKPCPCCASPGEGYSGATIGDWACCSKESCPLSIEWVKLVVWQSRPIEDALRAEVERLKEQLEDAQQDNQDAEWLEGLHVSEWKARTESAEARVAELEESLSQLLTSSNDLKRALWERVQELEAQIAEMEANRGGFTLGYLEQQQEPLKARVAELEAENLALDRDAEGLAQRIAPLQDRIRELEARLAEREAHFPRSSEGHLLTPGASVSCRRGHVNKLRAHDIAERRVYCTTGDCWDIGCQSDSGSGTRHKLSDCTVPPATVSEADVPTHWMPLPSAPEVTGV